MSIYGCCGFRPQQEKTITDKKFDEDVKKLIPEIIKGYEISEDNLEELAKKTKENMRFESSTQAMYFLYLIMKGEKSIIYKIAEGNYEALIPELAKGYGETENEMETRIQRDLQAAIDDDEQPTCREDQIIFMYKLMKQIEVKTDEDIEALIPKIAEGYGKTKDEIEFLIQKVCLSCLFTHRADGIVFLNESLKNKEFVAGEKK